MPEVSANSKRLAKNTILLYIRTFITLIVMLYTSRVVLRQLGVEDYGIYNVVGGVVTMFSVLTASLSTAISRFTTFELGRGDKKQINKVFCTSVNILIILIVIIVILIETIGLWFLNNKMIIPTERLAAANWVFQFSVIAFAINLWSVPYSALIIAHEHMTAYAYIGIVDAILRLAVAFLIAYNPFDKLIYYALLLMFSQIIIRFIYSLYCKKHFDESKFKLIFDKGLTKEMFGFAGWNFVGCSADVFRDQGGNIIINLFYPPAVNAARAIAMQVSSAIQSFVNNFMTAIRPQITKSYAVGNNDYVLNLIYRGSKYIFFLFLLMALPIWVTTPYLLQLWLGVGQVPEHTVNFVRLVLFLIMNETMSGPIITAVQATGDIKKYQLIVGGFQLLNLPLSYIFLYLGFPVECVFVVAVIISCAIVFLRVFMLRRMVNISLFKFYISVYFRSILVGIVAAVVPVIYMLNTEQSMASFLLQCVLTLVFSVLSIYIVGCNQDEKLFVKLQLLKKLRIGGNAK